MPSFLIESEVQMEYVLNALRLAHGLHCASDDQAHHCQATAQHMLGQILCSRAEAAASTQGLLGNSNIRPEDLI